MNADDTLRLLTEELAEALVPLEEAVASPERFAALLREMGWDFTGLFPPPLASLSRGVADLRTALDTVVTGTPSPQQLEDLATAIRDLVGAVRELSNLPPGSFPAELEAAGFVDEFPARLVQLLVVTHLQQNHSRVETLLRVVGIVRVELVQATGDRPAYVARRLALPDLAVLLRDPGLLLERAYGWRTMGFRYQDVFEDVADLAASFGLDVYFDELDPRLVLVLEAGAVVPGRPVRWSLKAPLLVGEVAGTSVEAGVGLFALPAQGAHLPGLSVLPYSEGKLQERVQLSQRVLLVFEAAADLTAGVGVVLRPHEPIDVLTELIPSAEAGVAPPSGGRLRVRVEVDKAEELPTVLLGAGGVGRLEVRRSSLTGTAEVDSTGGRTLGVELEFQDAALLITPDGADSFVRSILPAEGLKAEFDFGLAWSHERGLTFSGAGGLDVTLPVGLSIGNLITVPTVHVSLRAGDSGVAAELSASVGGSLGPVDMVVDELGMAAVVTFPEDGGNLGVADLDFRFKPPTGVGLTIDAAVVSGGGYLRFDPQNAEYAGALDLTIADVAVKAYGLVQTKLPGGAPGYSFVAVISTEFSPGLQLPFGFSLDGVGGLLGVHRTIAEDAVQAAVWGHHLDGLLFPKDPVASAPQLIPALEAYFPAAPGRYLLGPLAKIGWLGIVAGEVAFLLELPEPLKLLLIGEIQVAVPSEHPQLELHISFDGGIDFAKKLAFFDASLHDSRIESYPISGDLAFRYDWGDQGVFALALGGFNPHFQPPAAFPTLKRLAISIGSSVAQIEAQAYLAVTSNSLQFGARVELTAGTGGFNVHGWLGFDALCERHPLFFAFDLSAGIELRHGSSVLASVHLDGHFSGPSPWHINGDASLSLLFFEVTVHFDKTWGGDVGVLPAPDPLPALQAGLADRSSWSATLPPAARAVVTPVGAPPDGREALLLDPAASLRIAQRAVPLSLPITRFGGALLGRTVQFSIDAVTVFGSGPPSASATTEEFAPAQFFDLSDAEKLSLPSFSRFDAGVEVGRDAVDLGRSERPRAVITPLVYDTTIVDTAVRRPGGHYVPDMAVFIALNGSAQRSAGGIDRYRPAPGTAPRVTLAAERWVVAGTTDLGLRTEIESDGSKLGARLALAGYLAANPTQAGELQVVLAEDTAA